RQTLFSSKPFGPRAPGSPPPCPGSITIVRPLEAAALDPAEPAVLCESLDDAALGALLVVTALLLSPAAGRESPSDVEPKIGRIVCINAWRTLCGAISAARTNTVAKTPLHASHP